MNKISRYVLVVFVFASMILSACSGAASSVASDGGKVQASSIAYTGTIESINGNQWVVNGQTITVDPSVVNDGPFNVGDMVKVEVQIAQDGSVTVTRVEVPSQVDLSMLPGLGDDNSNSANSNDDNSNAVNGNDDNSNSVNGTKSNDNNGNDDNSNVSNGNDDNSNDSNEVFGLVEAISPTSITIDGQTYDIQPGGEVKGTIQVGDFVKLHLVQNADGTFSVRELGLSVSSQNGNDDNGNDSNSNSVNGNDDNSGKASHSVGSNDNSGSCSHGGSNDNRGGSNDNSGGSNDNSGGSNDNGGNGNG
ncbi:MAG: DUF5666 domain-containing protein [Chloroflexi bacterium]|nr:DUF5666 domain-containing protein [Chloroflexota bacterium]